MPLDDVDIHAKLKSQLLAAMVAAVELVARDFAADAGACRLFNSSGDQCQPASYAAARQLALDDDQRAALEQWPEQSGSLLSVLSDEELTESVFRPRDLMPGKAAEPQLYQGMPAAAQVRDALCACVPLDDQAWIALAWLRCNESKPFSLHEVRGVMGIYPTLQRRLRQGYEGEMLTDATNHPSIAASQAGPTGNNGGDSVYGRLSSTEQQVLDHLRRGRTERETAEHLGRSRHTVHVHVKSIYRKLGVYSRRELMELVTTAP